MSRVARWWFTSALCGWSAVACGGTVDAIESSSAGAGGGAGSDAGRDVASDSVADVDRDAGVCPAPAEVTVGVSCQVPGRFCSNGCADCYCNPGGDWTCGLQLCLDAAAAGCPDAAPASATACDPPGAQCFYGSGCSSVSCTCVADGGAASWSCLYAVC